MGLFDDLYNQSQLSGAFGATTLPAIPTATTTAPDQNPFTALLAKLFAPTNTTTGAKPATDLGALINALRTTPHYGIGGNLLPTGSTGGLTPEADWRKMFPNKPPGY
jgi:hypothetical protein